MMYALKGRGIGKQLGQARSAVETCHAQDNAHILLLCASAATVGAQLEWCKDVAAKRKYAISRATATMLYFPNGSVIMCKTSAQLNEERAKHD